MVDEGEEVNKSSFVRHTFQKKRMVWLVNQSRDETCYIF